MKLYTKKQILQLANSLDDANKYRLTDAFFAMVEASKEKKLQAEWDGDAQELRVWEEGTGY